MDKNEIFIVLKKQIVEILPLSTEIQINIELNLSDLGANSLDRGNIIIQSMEKLGLKVPLIELAKAKNISDLIDIFYLYLHNK